ncbi:3-oxoacyl-[acyl-carrier-protein] synthase 3 protein 1 [Lentzea sp. NBRC 105346]|uniref:beta-ketoacyl-ACP synthase III n=1 Tax=Lentzea sp. NBRC 105346 TaxID=3032205 RepID=UPI0024A52B1D|nr:beta-ketoacyl-ACP synthase III [Lentzea sp. NBRC 105346]GLZ28591.1 3-oxoacyl-[acyl-carrier-protein] synthase 3 protein 1 [Lentzea sp. NBRC 105346]
MRQSRIVSVGAYRPAREVGNDEVCALIDSTDEWVRRRSGITSRRYASADETVVTMGEEAARIALSRAGLDVSEVDTVILATMSHLHQSPAAAPQIASRLGTKCAAFDISAACAGFCHALGVADALVRGGCAEHVLVVGSEKMTDIIDPLDRTTAFLFGDGAGAAVVSPSDVRGIGPVEWSSDGGNHHLIEHSSSWLDLRDKPDAEWPTMRMSGQEVFRWATQHVPEAAAAALAKAGVRADELAALVPHQANLRIVETIASKLGLPPHVAVARDVVTAGNTSSASIPLALDALLSSGEVAPGGSALLVGFGAGLAVASQVVTLP